MSTPQGPVTGAVTGAAGPPSSGVPGVVLAMTLGQKVPGTYPRPEDAQAETEQTEGRGPCPLILSFGKTAELGSRPACFQEEDRGLF